jgi:hypothetical protein
MLSVNPDTDPKFQLHEFQILKKMYFAFGNHVDKGKIVCIPMLESSPFAPPWWRPAGPEMRVNSRKFHPIDISLEHFQISGHRLSQICQLTKLQATASPTGEARCRGMLRPLKMGPNISFQFERLRKTKPGSPQKAVGGSEFGFQIFGFPPKLETLESWDRS